MPIERELPKYLCRKQVWALEIKMIEGTIIHPVNEMYSPFDVGAEFFNKHNPVIGGYFVRYKDGYESFSPKKEFEDGYSEIDENCIKENKA